MNFITPEELQAYSNKFVGDDNALLKTYCDAGMEAVRDFLRYNPESTELECVKEGADSLYLALDAQPVTEILGADEDGEEIDPAEFRLGEDNLVAFASRRKFRAGSLYTIKYKGGYEQVPEKIRTCALQVAAMYWERAGGNLAVNSISLADGTRQFSNRTADFFLNEIKGYRILRLF